jgi:glutamine synthetase
MKRIHEYFGELTFNKKVMRQKLSKDVYLKLLETIEKDKPLNESIAPEVANAMKEWGIENGATHFTHWFQPRRSGTAEKHDSFISYDENGDIIERFSSQQLIQSEPDASSFPSGGIRSTFEARGYTAWDPGSPAFLMKDANTTTLVIPSVFLSFTGDVLDLKTPMLRAERALNNSCVKLLKLLGNRYVRRIRVYAGIEQEYFLISRKLYDLRPDLRICGRTLFGDSPAKGQEMEDHYFGTIKERIMNFMSELDHELYRRGIPSKTRHNEVAPNQFELASLYEEERLSIDHNLQLMNIMQRIGHRHGFKVLLKEKPFKGVNGSGKHFNWSIGDEVSGNFLKPSKSPLKNISFLMSIAALLLGLNRYGDLVRAAVANAGNDHRLGGFEAPPAIMSVYLGDYLTSILNEIEGIGKLTEKNLAKINLEVRNLPRIARDISDRNRTSPIAFTGDKFEFRVVGSSMNCSEIATVVNTLVAYGFDEIYARLKRKKGDKKKIAILILKDIIQETRNIRFEGNNYSKEWLLEAAERGLANRKNTPEALTVLADENYISLFVERMIYSKRELSALVEIKIHEYNKIKGIEFKTAINMVNTMILPAISRYMQEISNSCISLKKAGFNNSELRQNIELLSAIYSKLTFCIKQLEKSMIEAGLINNEFEKANFYVENGIINLDKIREQVDRAETIVADDLWPLPKYQELLTKI